MCCTEIENWTDLTEITDMIETCPRYSRDLTREGEVRVRVAGEVRGVEPPCYLVTPLFI